MHEERLLWQGWLEAELREPGCPHAQLLVVLSAQRRVQLTTRVSPARVVSACPSSSSSAVSTVPAGAQGLSRAACKS